ncbi:hypothetical protein KZZ52_47605 [Dactylosporangium sp. AC04546]|uniref:hypothetical protein n=1 Tax=Dactylosporangium sp. AC04546 TaxID=2862460 RepID=UPI001EDD5FEC|nr:hypothetical protein [Dactylosporangium sp. AC04546]WVK81576.1 hypothetical protein KZZ52_47605 [Dactylosporangium sp. AC04546]
MAPQDLRSLLTTARDDAPPPRLSVDDITTAGRQLVRRRRRIALLSSVAGSAVAAITAVAVAVMLNTPQPITPALDPSGLPAKPSPTPAQFAAAAPFVTTYAGYKAGRYSVSDPNLVTTAYQQSSIDETTGPPGTPATPIAPSASATAPNTNPRGISQPGGTLVVYRPGAFEPSEFDPAEKIQLRSGPGLLHYAGQLSAPQADKALAEKYAMMGAPIPAFAWRYAADAWAAVYWTSWEQTPTRDELVAIADGLSPATPKPFPIGFQAQLIPKNYSLAAASYGQDIASGERLVSAVRLTPKPIAVPLTRPINFDDYLTATLAIGLPSPDGKITKGRSSCPSDALATCMYLTEAGTLVLVDYSSPKEAVGTPPALVAQRMNPADPTDPGSWPPVTEVFGT